MKTITVVTVSVKNLIGQPDASIANMKKWVEAAREKRAELVFFPEFNVSGYIPAPVSHRITLPGFLFR